MRLSTDARPSRPTVTAAHLVRFLRRLRGGAFGRVALTAAIVAAIGLLVVSSWSVGAATANRTPAPAFTSACPTLNLSTPICHVFLVFLENQEFGHVMHNGTFERYLAGKYALASQFYSVIHYSFPAYVAASSGTVSNFVNPMNQTNVVDLIKNRTPALTWDAYMQGMPAPCYQRDTAFYKAAHNPFPFYDDLISGHRTYCRAHDLNFTAWTAAVGSGTFPNYGFIAPNVSNSCWKLGLAVCDAWLHNWLTPLVNKTFFKSSVFLISYDEGATNDTQGINGTKGGGHVYMVAVSPYSCKAKNSTYNYNHYSLLTTTEWLLKLGRLGTNDNWSAHPPMRDLFCFPNGTVPGVAIGAPLVPSVSGPSAGIVARARPTVSVAA